MDNLTISVQTALGITMIGIGLLVLLVWLVLLVLLVYIPSRQDSDNDEYTKIPRESDSKTNTCIPSEESSSSQLTIYSFTTKKKINPCPFCDGENTLEAKVCNICSRDL